MMPDDDAPNAGSESPTPFPVLRSVAAARPLRWLVLGFADLKCCPGPSLFYGLCFAAMGVLLTTVFRHAYPYLTALVSGFLLLGPVLAGGHYEISRRRERGEACALGPTLLAWRRNLGNIGIFALVLGIVFLVWARASLVIFALFYEGELPSLDGFIAQVMALDNLEFLLVYSSVGLLFATLVFALSVVSIPLMLDRNQDAVTAMIASVGALLRNPVAMALWALLIVSLTLVGFLTLYLGLIVLIPLIGHATWHAYRDLIAPR